MVRVVFAGATGLAILLLLGTEPGRASLYQPDDPMIVPVRPDGLAEPFPFNEFSRRMGLLADLANPTLKGPDGGPTARDRLVARVKSQQKNRRALSPEGTAALAADMLRLGNGDTGFYVNNALDLLSPHTADRVPNYFICTTLAQVHASLGSWSAAISHHESALLDCTMPAHVKGWSGPQRDWVAKLDREYVPRYYWVRKAEADSRPAPEAEEPTPLFPLPERNKPARPVRFVNDAGSYEPGTLAGAERAKLPPDALAIVQQLLLWFPSDTRLYWLLAELYAEKGELDAAQQVMDVCVSARQYGNRKILVAHRAAVRAAAAARPRADSTEDLIPSTAGPSPDSGNNSQKLPISMRTVWIYFGAVVLVGVFAAVRAVTRRRRGR